MSFSLVLIPKLVTLNDVGLRYDRSAFSAVTTVYNDLLLAADVGQLSVLCLLDLTAAFDTVDHQLLLLRASVWSAWCRLVLVLVVFDR